MTPLSFKNSLYIIKYLLELIQRQSLIDGIHEERITLREDVSKYKFILILYRFDLKKSKKSTQ
jgi:hypothetical protein